MGNITGISSQINSDANSASGTIGGLGNLFYSTRNILNPGSQQWSEVDNHGSIYGTTLSPGQVRSATIPGFLEGSHLRGNNSFFATPLGFMVIIGVIIAIIFIIFDRKK